MKKFSAIISIVLLISLLSACAAKQTSGDNNPQASLSSASSQPTSENASEGLSADEESSADSENKESVNSAQGSKVSASSNQKQASPDKKPVNKETTTLASQQKPNPPAPTRPPSNNNTTQNIEKYTVEELWCKNGSLNIYGKMYKPNKSGKLPAVILSHSFSLSSYSLECYAKLLAEEGYASYVFDFCGGSLRKNKSDGSKDDMTVFTEVADLEAVLSKVRSLNYVDKNKIFLFGTSQGGLVSALVANNHNSQIKGMILLYPGFSMAEQIKSNSYFAGMALGEKYINAIKDYDIYGNIGGFTKDVLIIHGTNDTQVPIKYSERALEVYKSAELIRIKGANHGFNSSNTFGMGGNFDSEVNPHIIDFMKSHA